MVSRTIGAAMGLLVVLQLTQAAAQTETPPPPGAGAPSANSPVRTVPTEPPRPGSDDPRYSFHRVPDGYLRLDANTGHVALCSRRQVGWACQAIPDERTALESEIARLQIENGALKKLVLSRGLALPHGISPSSPGRSGEAKPPPGGSIFDQFMSVVAATWHRLVEVVAKIQRDMSKDG